MIRKDAAPWAAVSAMMLMAKASPPEHCRFKARLHALEQQAESRIVFPYLLPSFLDHCGRPHRQEKNPVLGRVFHGKGDVVQHYFPESLRLTKEASIDFNPVWSPDGRYIAFCRILRGESGIYIIPASGGKQYPRRATVCTKIGVSADSPSASRNLLIAALRL